MSHARTSLSTGHRYLDIQITDDGSRTLIQTDTGVAFHSGSGAITETRHVYLENSGVATRLRDGRSTSVLEIGLGTGMGLLITLDLAVHMSTPLYYLAVDQQLLSADLLRQLNLGCHLMDPNMSVRFLEWRKSLGGDVSDGRYQWTPDECVRSDIWVTDAREISKNDAAADSFDAIYFDPFAPEVNPGLWESSYLSQLHSMLTDEGCLVTYCVSRQVRESLQSAGFQTRRVKGPRGGKREVMIATKS